MINPTGQPAPAIPRNPALTLIILAERAGVALIANESCELGVTAPALLPKSGALVQLEQLQVEEKSAVRVFISRLACGDSSIGLSS